MTAVDFSHVPGGRERSLYYIKSPSISKSQDIFNQKICPAGDSSYLDRKSQLDRLMGGNTPERINPKAKPP
jgi:hypothetical protein